MTSEYDPLVAELRLLAEAVLDRVDRAVQQYAATQHTGPGDHAAPEPDEPVPGVSGAPAGCAWCPVCAVAALLRGEPHELLTRLATQIAAIVALIRELLARYLPAPAGPAGPDSPPPEPAERGSGFVPIQVTIHP